MICQRRFPALMRAQKVQNKVGTRQFRLVRISVLVLAKVDEELAEAKDSHFIGRSGSDLR